MAVVMLVLLTTILGTIALASRSTSGLAAARSQSSNREARDIAESGVTEIISELNKEQNRQLLILPTGSWSSAQTNPCSALDSTGGAVSPIPAPTTKALNFASSNWINLNSGDSTKQFRLVSASATNTARTALSSTISTNQLQGLEKTLFKVTVTGRVRNTAGNEISTATISREYEVVPKCCKRSFGRNATSATIYGEDTRTCLAGASGGLGIVLGLNGGTLTTSNNTFNITDQNGLPITRVLCAQGTGRPSCDNSSWTLGASVSVVPTTFSTPFPPSKSTATATSINTTSRNYILINSNKVEQCSTASNCQDITSCQIVSGEAWCNLTSINSKNTVTTFDTTNGKINLYFTGNSGDYIDIGGNGEIRHVRCPSFSSGTLCTTNANLSSVENFNVFISGNGTLTIKGTASALAINIWNNNGTTDISGNASLIGRIWTRNFNTNGNVTMQVPTSSPTQFCPTISQCPPQAGGSPSTDWVARSITQSSNF